MTPEKGPRGALAAGSLAAILGSACCLGPLALLSLGVSGAWISNLTLLEPFQPWFLGGALLALLFAYRGIYRPVAGCAPDEACANPATRRTYRIVFWLVAALVLLGFGFPYVAPLFY